MKGIVLSLDYSGCFDKMRVSQDTTKKDIGQWGETMPMGIQQTNNLLHLTLDIWQDQVFFNEIAYPAGHFAADLLNVSPEMLQELLTLGGTISHQVEALAFAEPSRFVHLLQETRPTLEPLLDILWRCPPYCFLDKAQELHAVDVLFSPASHNDLLHPASPIRQFFFRYLTAAFSIPLGIYHFSVAGLYFEVEYLRRLKKRNETFFATAARDCFNSEDFWAMMHKLSYAEIEPFTISPTISSTYTFARNPKHETDTVFVQRIEFPTLIHFYIFDLLNGLHHGHAPSQCQNCGHYFLTTNAHVPKYCDGIAPQDSRMTCRQYGAMMHQKEQNKHHPIYSLFNTRTGTIRKHHQRRKISDELRQEALHLAAVCRDKALMDNDYAAHGYAQNMELEALYAQAQRRLERGKQS